MMSTRTLLKGAAIGTTDPGNVLREVNNLLNEDNEAAMFVTILYAVYDPASGELTYTNGGHNSPLIVHADGKSELLPLTDGIALGLVPDLEYREGSLTLSPGDTIVLYTDGVTEAMNGEDVEFGNDRLREIFTAGPPANAEEANMGVLHAVDTFVVGTPQSDDITCLTLCRGEFGT